MSIARVAISPLKFGNAGFTSDAFDSTGANCIVVPLASYELGAAVIDNKGNTYAPLTQYGAEGRYSRFWYSIGANLVSVGSGHTITVSGAGTYDNGCAIAYSGVSTYDTSTGAAALNPATLSPGAINPAGDGELFLTMAATYTNDITTIDTATSGFTVIGHLASTESMAVAELIETTAASKNPVWSNSGTNNHMSCAMVAFTPAAGGGGATSMSAASGSLSLTGEPSTFVSALTTATSAFSLTGEAATFLQSLGVNPGTLTLTGNAATFNLTGAYSLPAAAGSYTLSGGDATFNTALAAAMGAVTETGRDATFLLASGALEAGPGSFVLTPQTVAFDTTLVGAPGAFSETGQPATLAVVRYAEKVFAFIVV